MPVPELTCLSCKTPSELQIMELQYLEAILDSSGGGSVGGSTNITAINGVAASVNCGTANSGTLRVAQATDCLVAAQGAAAHDSAVTGNPLLMGAEARVVLGTAVTAGDAVRIAANRYGSPLVSAYVPTHASSNGTPIAATTATVIAAPAAGSHIRVVRFHISNGGATSTWVAIRDGAAGTQYYRTFLPTGGVISLNLNASGPLDLTTATRLDIVLSAAGSVEYNIDYHVVAD